MPRDAEPGGWREWSSEGTACICPRRKQPSEGERFRRGAEKTDLLTTPHFERSEQNKPAHCATIADVLAVAKPCGLMLCPGRHAEHRALLLCLGRGEDSRPFLELFGWLSCEVMKRKRSGAKITSQVSANGGAESFRLRES